MTWGNPWAEGMLTAKQIVGKTVDSVEIVPALYGTTPDGLLLLRFTDGTRSVVLLKGNGSGENIVGCARFVDSDGMRKAPLFFTEDEVADEVRREMASARQRKRDEQERKRLEIERLQRELADA